MHRTVRSRPSLRLPIAAVAVLLLIGGAAVPAAAAGARDDGPAFEFWMPDRFGIDLDRDGLVDMPNRLSYAMGTTDAACDPACPDPVFPVVLEADPGGADPGSPVTYEWTLVPATGPAQTHVRHVPTLVARLPEGTVQVTLRVVVGTPPRSYGAVTTGTIVVDDLLVVAIGDSYASGDGNPERPRGDGDATWGDGVGDAAVEADHAAARRSSVAWPAQLAMALERADRTTSVTFLSVAASGASIERGVLGAQSSPLPIPQLDRVEELVGEREIDLLVVSIGGNDIGFSRLVAGLVDADPWLDPICYENDLENVWASVADGAWDRASHLVWRITDPFHLRCATERLDGGAYVAGLDRLPEELDRLAASVDTRLQPARVLLAEYPDPTGFGTGEATEICDEIVGDAAPFGLHEINRDEQRLGRSYVLGPLNDMLDAAASRNGWVLVTGIADAFTNGHGYCAPWPDYGYPVGFDTGLALFRDRLDHPDAWYRNGGISGTTPVGGAVSWYRTAGQSVVLQGPDSRIDTTGTMHPNELGHLEMAQRALAAWEPG